MGKSPTGAAIADQKRVTQELQALSVSKDQEIDNLGSVLLSVVRDMAIGGLYGRKTADSIGGAQLPALDEVFSSEFARHVEAYLLDLQVVRTVAGPLYGTIGDLVSYLARLLIFVRESADLEPYIAAANAAIAATGVSSDFMQDGDYLRHLRNSIVHARFMVKVDPADPFQSVVVFLDLAPSNGKVTAKIVSTTDQLVQIVRFIIHEVYEKFLVDCGWVVG